LPQDDQDRGQTGEGLVGPILRSGVTANAIIAAIRELNEGVTVLDRGSYLRVGAPGRCIVTRSAIEAHLGRPFRLPADLEPMMPSFAGHLAISDDEARWSSNRGAS
jgi:hypothetical protein